jgi:hypothetical protein
MKTSPRFLLGINRKMIGEAIYLRVCDRKYNPIATKRGNVLTRSCRSKSAVFRMHSSLTSHGYSKSKNDHIIFNVGTPSLEARNIRLVNIITYIIAESKLISENMSPNVIHC